MKVFNYAVFVSYTIREARAERGGGWTMDLGTMAWWGERFVDRL